MPLSSRASVDAETGRSYDRTMAKAVAKSSALIDTRVIRAKRKLGYFVGFEFSRDALFEIDRFRRQTGCEIKPLTVREILDEEIAARPS